MDQDGLYCRPGNARFRLRELCVVAQVGRNILIDTYTAKIPVSQLYTARVAPQVPSQESHTHSMLTQQKIAKQFGCDELYTAIADYDAMTTPEEKKQCIVRRGDEGVKTQHFTKASIKAMVEKAGRFFFWENVTKASIKTMVEKAGRVLEHSTWKWDIWNSRHLNLPRVRRFGQGFGGGQGFGWFSGKGFGWDWFFVLHVRFWRWKGFVGGQVWEESICWGKALENGHYTQCHFLPPFLSDEVSPCSRR